MDFYFLARDADKVRNAETAKQHAYAAGIREGERWKYFAVNPDVCEATETGFSFENPKPMRLKNMSLDEMLELFHDMTEKYGFLELDYGNLRSTPMTKREGNNDASNGA